MKSLVTNLNKWAFPLTDIGIVQEIFSVSGKTIVSVVLSGANDPAAKIGDVVVFEGNRRVVLSGLKYWPEKNVVDLLFDELPFIPEVGDSVSL